MLHASYVRAALPLLIGFTCLRANAQTPEYRASWADAFHAGYLSKSAVTTSIANLRSGNCNVFIPEVYVNKGSQLIYWNPTASEYPDLGAAATIVSNGVPITCDLNSDPETNSGGSFDALAECIAQAHDTTGGKQRIDIWAWYVAFRSAGAVPAAHPSWITVNASVPPLASTDFDAGHPGAAQQLYNHVMDVVRHYNIDGLNFDYIRLTHANDGFNPISVQRYNAIKGKTGTPTTSDAAYKQWRRDQITNVVRKIYLNTIAIKPNVRMTADLITWGDGPVRPVAGDPNSLATWKTSFSSSSAYSSVLQDWRSWMEEGILDVAIPMNYYRECTHEDAFNRWSDFTKDIQYGRQGMIGPGGYLNALDAAYAQMKRTRLPSSTMGKYGVGGSNYSYAVPYAATCGGTQQADPEGWASALANGIPSDPVAIYPTTAPLPALPRLTNGKGHLKGTVINTRVASPGWVDGGTVSITGPASRSMKTDGTGFYGFVDLPPGTYSVTASAPGVNSQTKPVTITAHAVSTTDFALSLIVPAQVAFTRQPSGASTGLAFTTQPMLAAQDASGNVVTSFTGSITVGIKSGTGASGAVLNGTATVNAVNGVATFSGLSISTPGTGYVLTATSSGLIASESSSFTVLPVAVKLVVTSQPQGSMVGHPLSVPPVVSVQDDLGNLCTWSSDPLTITIMAGTGTPGASLTGSTTVNAVNGVATFGDLSLDKVGFAYRLTASGATLTPVDTLAFDITTTAVKMAFQTQPGGAKAGIAFAAQPIIVAQNAGDGTATDYDGVVTLNIKDGTGAPTAYLDGTASVNMVNGVGTFTSLMISEAGSGYVLTASSGALPEVDSVAFNILSAAPYTLAEVAQAASIAGGLTIAVANDTLRLDTDQSGGIDMTDATRIARKVAGLEANP